MTEREQRHFEVALEQILHEVRTVAEGHSTLDGKMARFHKEAKEDHRTAMDLIKFSHDELNHKIDGVEKRLDAKLDGVRTGLKEDIQGVRTELRETREELSTKIDAVGTKVDGHEDRIRFLERKAA